MSTQDRNYTREFKQDAVELALKPTSIAHTARELGITANALHIGIKLMPRSSALPNCAKY
jgi:transposase-like protein